jgi:hypothetical protein
MHLAYEIYAYLVVGDHPCFCDCSVWFGGSLDATLRRGDIYFENLRSKLDTQPEPGSPQHTALTWLAQTDLYFYFRGEPEQDRLIQRYALLVLHFATDVWGCRDGWLK